MPNNTMVLGYQFGDEGKGKVVDCISKHFDYIARFQGGANAGHTVVIGDQKHILHLLPSGAVSGRKVVLGNGMVINPTALWQELEQVSKVVNDIFKKLLISERAHLTAPWHLLLEQARKNATGFELGTTIKGIGPTYEDKMARIGITAGMVHYPKELREWVFASYKTAKRELESLGVKFNEFPEEVWKQINPLGFIDSIKNLTPFVCDTSKVLREAIRRGESLLIEGAQGAGLDIDHGTYPYVTSSTTLAAGASAGLGVPMSALGSVIGVMKAYTTCVGARPFPTELPEGKARDHIREVGNEYGASTGRARRIGYLDFVQLEQATSLNDTAALVLTKADVLSNTGRVGICTQYAEEGKKVITDFPTSFALQKCKGHITFVEGWGDISSVTEFNKLPKTFRKFVALIEDRLNIPVKAISTGPERSQLIIRKDINTPGLEFMDDL